jgi:hypothetical protein
VLLLLPLILIKEVGGEIENDRDTSKKVELLSMETVQSTDGRRHSAERVAEWFVLRWRGRKSRESREMRWGRLYSKCRQCRRGREGGRR